MKATHDSRTVLFFYRRTSIAIETIIS